MADTVEISGTLSALGGVGGTTVVGFTSAYGGDGGDGSVGRIWIDGTSVDDTGASVSPGWAVP
ncbi:MAG: hypothetical protein FJ090_21900 [Deltaproteobacteria bacterium]|nr:hypothetical protein [Deltaproteobacteria bacterium]